MKVITQEMVDLAGKKALDRQMAGLKADIHTILAAEIYQVPEASVTTEMRQAAKQSAYIWMYSN